MRELYDRIGINYSSGRKTDPYIASIISSYFNTSTSILNIGAGTGSYKPSFVNLVALDPSDKMIMQPYNYRFLKISFNIQMPNPLAHHVKT